MERTEYIFDCQFISAYDGDSLTIVNDLGYTVTKEEKVRLKGLDTPELRGGTDLTKAAAKAVRDYVTWWCKGNNLVSRSLRNDKGKYGRYLVEIYKGDALLNNHLIEIGFARPYFGDQRKPWTSSEARRILDSPYLKRISSTA